MSGPGYRRRWWRWLLVGVVLLVVLVMGGAAIFVKSQPSAAPLTLPAAAARPPDGTWDVTAGSVAGFRIRESALGFGGDVTGRTTAVSGTAVIVGGRVASAAFRIDLTAITVGGKPKPQLATGLDTVAHPDATITIAGPARLPAGSAAGEPSPRRFPAVRQVSTVPAAGNWMPEAPSRALRPLATPAPGPADRAGHRRRRPAS